VLVPFVGGIIGIWGWRVAAIVSACLLLLIGVPVAWGINRIAQREEDDHANRRNRRTVINKSRRLGPAIHTQRGFAPARFLVALGRHGVAPHGDEGVSCISSSFLVDRGWSMEAASTLLGVSALSACRLGLGAGWLGDLVDKRKLVMVYCWR
jgi:hypothetical protein